MSASAAVAVLKRLLGERANEFHLELELPDGDWFRVGAVSGRVKVQAGSAIALCRGVYDYLKRECGVGIWWSEEALVLPNPLPDCWQRRGSSPHAYRYYLSVCAFGYSAPWWDWARWEREIDWMAMHGINMPLALCGQELIWQRVYRWLGIPDEAIERQFSGPAYLPWHRLGNLNGHLGPLPQHWIEDQALLQKRILVRVRELGMMPVVPGFSGFVPAEIRQEVELRSAEPWAGFPPTTFIDPRSTLFKEIGARFLQEYRADFGPAHHYLCETFAEQRPQFSPSTELEDLRAIGSATWETLHHSDPEAHWVIQGWPFFYDRSYWTPERTAALFQDVPAGRLAILDMATEDLEVWREQPAVREKGWLHCAVHNFGQNTPLQGDLAGFCDRMYEATHDADRGLLLGVGIVPEGIDQNPVVYELLTDLAWTNDRVLPSEWIEGYVRARYGALDPDALRAWRVLLESVYGRRRAPSLRITWRYRPGDQPPLPDVDTAAVLDAVRALYRARVHLGGRTSYLRDLVDVTKTWLSGLADQALNGGPSDIFFAMLQDLDRLMATLPEHRLSTWIAAARAAGGPNADLFERNARTLLTTWGGPVLFDYATREWAGIILDFHLERWRRYLADPEKDFAAWEAEWASSLCAPKESVGGSPVEVVGELLTKYGDVVVTGPEPEPTTFGPMPMTAPWRIDVDLGQERSVSGAMVVPMFGQGCLAGYELRTSTDGEDWTPPEGRPKAYRGARWQFEARAASVIRIEVIPEGCAEDQWFSVYLYEDVTPSSQ